MYSMKQPKCHVMYVIIVVGDKRYRLHKFLTGNERTDHRNGDGLDNRRSNLRRATHAENMRNGRKREIGKNKYKGAFWHKGASKWMAQLCFNRRRVYGGLFETDVEAARAYDALALQYHGEFARLNFPNG